MTISTTAGQERKSLEDSGDDKWVEKSSDEETGLDAEIPESWQPGIEWTREIATYAEELVKQFPEITLGSWRFLYRWREGEWKQPGLSLLLTGPKMAVETFLARLGIACNLERFIILYDPETGRIYEAQLEPGKVD